MQCPSCGLQIDQQNSERCPRCGCMLSYPPTHYASDDTPGSTPDSGGQQGESQQTSGYRIPPAPENPYGTDGGSTPPSSYGQPTLQGYPIASDYPPPTYPRPLLAPLPERKPRAGRIVGIVALVVVVIAVCTGGALFAIHLLGQTTTGALSNTAGTPTPDVIYGAKLTSIDGAEGWSEVLDECFLGSDGYHVMRGYLCYAPAGTQADVDVSLMVQQISGPTNYGYGIVFRRVALGNYYLFMIDSNSKWLFVKCVNDTCTKMVDFTPNDAIKGGLKTVNALEVSAKGSHFDFFVNATKVGSADDSTFASGEVGVVGGSSSECVFTNFIVSLAR